MTSLKFFLAGLATGALILVTQTSYGHRLAGHPRSLKGKLELAKRQVVHDRQQISARHGWRLLSLTAVSHGWWLGRDVAYRDLLQRLVAPPLRSLVDACTAAIVDREDPSWDPGRWNSAGSGAFGLPQALPFSKMPRAAWPKSKGGREDPVAQLRWMVGYEIGRYGSPCAAWAHWQRNGSY
jgi:hypothetical protein